MANRTSSRPASLGADIIHRLRVAKARAPRPLIDAIGMAIEDMASDRFLLDAVRADDEAGT